MNAPGAPAGPHPSDQPTESGLAEAFPPSPDVPTWGQLRVIGEIGRGAFGRVFRAWDPTLAREVALKLITLESPDPAMAAAALREGRMLARVRHKNVVTVYGAQQVDQEIGLWMELVRGRSLSQMVHEDGPMAAEEAAVIGVSLCHALSAVHAAGLLHRDVKAQNVMRESGGRILLMDLGAGRDVAARHSAWGELAGTPLYMPPEVLAGRPWSAAGDVYSLGVLLFFLVTGRHPVEGRTVTDVVTAHGLGHRRLLADCRADLPEGFIRVVERAMAPIKERYQTAGAMMRELAEAIPGIAGSWPNEALTPRSGIDPASALPSVATGGTGSGGPGPWSATQWSIAAATTLAGLWLLGFMTSAAFDTNLGRVGQFSNESPLDWLIWGIRSLVGPALVMVLALTAYRLARFVGRLLDRFVPPLRRAVAWLRSRAALAAGAAGLADPNTRAQWLLGVQVVLFALVLWRFRELLWACTGFRNTSAPDPFGPLRPTSDEPVLYRAALSMVLLVTSLGWLRLLRRPPDEPRADRATIAAGLGMLALILVLLSVPFRMVYQTHERVDVGGSRCYITAQRDDKLLLFCPDVSPRIRVVSPADPRLNRPGIVESIFTEPSKSGQ